MDAILRLWRTRRVSVIIGGAVAAVALVVVGVLIFGGGDDKKPAAKSPRTTTTRRPATVRRAPLTGLPDKSGASFKRPAVTVKVNNNNLAKQYGIHEADIVYEEVVEGGATRLAAIFNSHDPDRVGPVRSVRRTDQSIVWPIGGIFAYSGGAQYAIDSIDTAPVKQLDETRAGSMMYREPNDPDYAPYNLWARVDQMFKAGGEPIPPKPLFTYRAAKAKVGGTPVKSFVVGFAGTDPPFATTWEWDAPSRKWLRSIFGGPDIDADNVRIAAQNVVVLFVEYAGGAGLEGAEAVLTGSGNALVYTGGKEIKGTWSRPDKEKPAKLLNANGAVIKLTPGKTWVALPDVSYTVTTTP